MWRAAIAGQSVWGPLARTRAPCDVTVTVTRFKHLHSTCIHLPTTEFLERSYIEEQSIRTRSYIRNNIGEDLLISTTVPRRLTCATQVRLVGNMPPMTMDYTVTTDRATFINTQRATELHNKAYATKQAGNLRGAVALFRQAIETKQKNGVSESSLAVSCNALGETFLELEEFDSAIEELKLALAIRMKLEPRKTHLFDTCVTRETLAQVYEAKGVPKLARQTREDGVKGGEICCSHYKCPKQNLTVEQLQRCSRCKVRSNDHLVTLTEYPITNWIMLT